jgi:hypothetical protein
LFPSLHSVTKSAGYNGDGVGLKFWKENLEKILVLAKGTGCVDSNQESFIQLLLVALTSTKDGAPSKTQQSLLLGLNPVTGWW